MPSNKNENFYIYKMSNFRYYILNQTYLIGLCFQRNLSITLAVFTKIVLYNNVNIFICVSV